MQKSKFHTHSIANHLGIHYKFFSLLSLHVLSEMLLVINAAIDVRAAGIKKIIVIAPNTAANSELIIRISIPTAAIAIYAFFTCFYPALNFRTVHSLLCA